jgi:GntR family transcriptional regulator
MLIRLSQSSSLSLSAQIAHQIRDAVAAGVLGPGDQLPPARELAESLGVNIHTVLRGYSDLRTAGIVDLRRGRAARISPDVEVAKTHIEARLVELLRDADAAGIDRSEIVRLVEGGHHES